MDGLDHLLTLNFNLDLLIIDELSCVLGPGSVPGYLTLI